MSTSIIIGIVIAAIVAFITHFLFKGRVLWVWRIGLIIAALIYVGFAISGDAPLEKDLLGVVIYSSFALLSIRYGLIWLAIGWALHIGWDVIVHLESSHVPTWYPALCFGFDVAIALYIIFLIRKTHEVNSPVTTS